MRVIVLVGHENTGKASTLNKVAHFLNASRNGYRMRASAPKGGASYPEDDAFYLFTNSNRNNICITTKGNSEEQIEANFDEMLEKLAALYNLASDDGEEDEFEDDEDIDDVEDAEGIGDAVDAEDIEDADDIGDADDMGVEYSESYLYESETASFESLENEVLAKLVWITAAKAEYTSDINNVSNYGPLYEHVRELVSDTDLNGKVEKPICKNELWHDEDNSDEFVDACAALNDLDKARVLSKLRSLKLKV